MRAAHHLAGARLELALVVEGDEAHARRPFDRALARHAGAAVRRGPQPARIGAERDAAHAGVLALAARRPRPTPQASGDSVERSGCQAASGAVGARRAQVAEHDARRGARLDVVRAAVAERPRRAGAAAVGALALHVGFFLDRGRHDLLRPVELHLTRVVAAHVLDGLGHGGFAPFAGGLPRGRLGGVGGDGKERHGGQQGQRQEGADGPCGEA